ncbi:DUF4405 domain-containing protein [Carboxylicivirga linearis]|uniref:DUF4405 domain-containing protein n=1 Tax=Carboxylicivirga linearis TaxID=1628157 RepID=A0ABS5JWZ0_9BACT|nr:DUF4405 domain-containing protein [Carboxylicivirga linearis]MBS2099426.1 DUF4405 domain-containing protein [Carboxylicivirga linearis]
MQTNEIRISKVKLNFIIDILMYLSMMIVVGIGFLMEYVLIPGSERHEVYGRNVELSFWNMDRHQWGNIHLIFGFVLIFLLLLHIIFHWKLIVAIYRRMISGKSIRIVLGIILLFLTLILAVAPIFVKPEIQEGGKGDHNGGVRGNRSSENHIESKVIKNNENVKQHEEYGVDIYGSMTLKEVSEKYNIPVNDLANAIDVPVSMADERLGRLKRDYGFDMNDLREYVEEMLIK